MMVVIMMVVVVVAIRATCMIMVVIVLIEKMRIVFQRPFQIEGALVEHLRQVDLGALGPVDAGGRVDGADGRLDLRQFFRGHQVGLVQEHDVGKGDLVFGFATILQAQRQVLGIDQCDDGIEFGLGAHIVIHEEGLGDGHRVSKAGRFDDDPIEAAGAAHQAFNDADQVAAHGATDTAIVHLVDFFVGLDNQVVVDADLAEFVDDDGIFPGHGSRKECG